VLLNIEAVRTRLRSPPPAGVHKDNKDFTNFRYGSYN